MFPVLSWRLLATVATMAACAADTITVVHKTLSLEEEHVLMVDSSLEYILQFEPNAEQGLYPMRMWMRSDAGDTARPLLLTARQRTGAVTWQLPYQAESGALLYEFQRTLCPDDAAAAGTDPTDCEGAGSTTRRGSFSLHVASSCASPATLRLRAVPARDWLLSEHAPAQLTASLTAPAVVRYQFPTTRDSVRLVVASPDDLCATIAVLNYQCPIAQSVSELQQSAVRMTVQRSGGVQLARSRYGRGFLLVALVAETDEACTGEPEESQDWLWEAAVWREEAHETNATRARLKQIHIEIKATLSVAQYAAACGATLAFFLAFYAAFGALVLAQRWPCWARLVRPQAVLAHRAEAGALSPAPAESTPDAGAPSAERRPRRDSTATFDSSDNSDTDSEGEATADTRTTAADTPAPPADSRDAPHAPADVPRPGAQDDTIPIEIHDRVHTTGNQQVADAGGVADGVADGVTRPFGLPARLRVAALARRRTRVLQARSQRYLYTLYTVAVFYALPVVQFVATFQVIMYVYGSLDLCYYNFLCAHPLGALSDFNHVFSNLGYLLLGALFMLQLRRRQARRRRRPRDEEYGIPAHYGLLASLGAGMMVVALLSASYHVCPNRLNFQFDTAFMYVLAVLSMVKIYQSRHPDINARAHATFGVLAVLIALVVWGVLGGGPLFWSVFTVLHVFTFLLLSLRIYYVGQFRLGKESLAEAARALRPSRPLYSARLTALFVANAVNWAFALYGLVQSTNIASHLLFVLLCNALLYMSFYLVMKLLHGERPRWYAWAYLGGAAAAWIPALYYFTAGSTDWSATPAASRHANHECRVLLFYDSHDLWHMLSAVALYFTFNAMLTWDDGLAAVPRTQIAVF